MTFDPENPLEQALLRAMTEPAVRPEFYRLLLGSNLFIIGQIAERAPGDGEIAAQASDRLMIATVDYQGRNCHPVFSALSRLRNFAGEEAQHLAIAGRKLFEASRGANYLLNPASECGKELRAEEIASILGPPPGEAPRVLIGQPEVYPQALVDSLKDLFARDAGVKAAHLVQIAFGGDEPPHPLIGVETEGDWPALAREMGEAMKTAMPETIVDMIPIDRAAPTGVMQALLKSPPFYTRA